MIAVDIDAGRRVGLDQRVDRDVRADLGRIDPRRPHVAAPTPGGRRPPRRGSSVAALSRSISSGSTGAPPTSSISSATRAAYCMHCTVSIPDRSSKNQPQLVYMSIAWRAISMSDSARTRSSASSACDAVRREERDRAPPACARAAPRCRRRARPTDRGTRSRRRCRAPPRPDRAASRTRRAAAAASFWFQPGLAAAVAAAVVAPARDAVHAAPRRVLGELRPPRSPAPARGTRRSWSAACRSSPARPAAAPTRAPCRRSDGGGRRSRRRSRCGTASARRRRPRRASVIRAMISWPFGEQALERDRLRGRAVVEEQIDRPARRQRAAIRAARYRSASSATRRPAAATPWPGAARAP